jgi:hypothetical protein
MQGLSRIYHHTHHHHHHRYCRPYLTAVQSTEKRQKWGHDKNSSTPALAIAADDGVVSRIHHHPTASAAVTLLITAMTTAEKTDTGSKIVVAVAIRVGSNDSKQQRIPYRSEGIRWRRKRRGRGS